MSRKGDKHWTSEQVQFLKDNYLKMSYAEISDAIGRTMQSIAYKARRLGLTFGLRHGAINGNWKGGISQLRSGYIRDNVAGKNVHTLVMEREIGRALTHPEMVHHIDGDKSNNNAINLCICDGPASHRLIHASLERAAFELVRKGLIRFDNCSHEYYI